LYQGSASQNLTGSNKYSELQDLLIPIAGLSKIVSLFQQKVGR
jgi:hypothetical protein